jgi:hypothetical protein
MGCARVAFYDPPNHINSYLFAVKVNAMVIKHVLLPATEGLKRADMGTFNAFVELAVMLKQPVPVHV